MFSFKFIVFNLIQLLVIVKCQVEELNLSPDIWKDNKELLELDDSPTPDFLSQGFRISEAKCLENIWEMEQEENRITNVMKYSPRGLFTVTGGGNAKPNEFPHMGALGWQTVKGGWSFKCGSFLISDQFLLTAAHCHVAPRDTELQDIKPKIVRLGVDNIIKGDEGKNPLDMKIMKFIQHPNYPGVTRRYNDIALIMLRQKVEFSKFVRPACIMNLKTDKAIVTGWGAIDTGRYSKRISDHLKAAEVDIVDSETCNYKLQAKISKKWNGMQDYQFCATDLDGIGDICYGDSGGPIQVKMDTKTKKPIYNVIGITSFGYICGNPNFPSVFTNVSSFIDWIEDSVWKGSNANPTTRNPILTNRPTESTKPTTTSHPTFRPTNNHPYFEPTTSHPIFRPTTTYPSFKPFTFPPFFKPTIQFSPFVPNVIPFDVPNPPSFYKPYYEYNNPIITNHLDDTFEVISNFDDVRIEIVNDFERKDYF